MTNTTAIAYLRVSTTEQGSSGLGLEAQITTISDYCRANGITLVATVTEVMSGKSLRNRPELTAALARMTKGEASMLIASNVSRLARSVADLSSMLELAERKGFAIGTCDGGVDTATPQGKMLTQILGVASEYERRMVSERTKKALAAARERGVVLGARKEIDQALEDSIVTRALDGETYATIADSLNAQEITTPRGATWTPQGVRKVAIRNGVAVRGQGRKAIATAA